MSLLHTVKNALIPNGTAPRSIMTGPFRGIQMNLDLQNSTQIVLGLYEREVFPALVELSQGIRSAVDVGVAQGEYTIYFLLRTGAERVISFEPDPGMFEPLEVNARLNGVTGNRRWELHKTFLGSTNEPGHTHANWLASRILSPCLIKIDIDGGEADVLRAATEVLPMPGVRWLIETHSIQLEKDCLEILGSAGYKTEIIKNAWWRGITGDQRPLELNRWLTAVRPE